MINKSNLENLRSFSDKAQRVVSRYYSDDNPRNRYYIITGAGVRLKTGYDTQKEAQDWIDAKIKENPNTKMYKAYKVVHGLQGTDPNSYGFSKLYSSKDIEVEEYNLDEWQSNYKANDYPKDLAVKVYNYLYSIANGNRFNVTSEANVVSGSDNFNKLLNELGELDGVTLYQDKELSAKWVCYPKDGPDYTIVVISEITRLNQYSPVEIIYLKWNAKNLNININ